MKLINLMVLDQSDVVCRSQLQLKVLTGIFHALLYHTGIRNAFRCLHKKSRAGCRSIGRQGMSAPSLGRLMASIPLPV